jgi:hypothetical protein
MADTTHPRGEIALIDEPHPLREYFAYQLAAAEARYASCGWDEAAAALNALRDARDAASMAAHS